MSAPAVFRGGCMCRAIRYEITAKPMSGGHCQCRDCQHESGGGLDDPSVFQPSFVCYTSRGHAWDLVDPALPSFSKKPRPEGAMP
jgi:hypothetical protein